LNITGGSFVSQQFDIGGGGNVSTTSTVTLASGLFSLVSLFRWGQGGTSGITTTSTFNLDGGTFSNGNAWLALKGSNTFNFNGGVFTSSTTPLNLTGLLISFLVKAGGAIIAPTSGKTINFDSVLSDASGVAGTLTKQDAGTLVLSQPNTISGAVTVSGGVLQIGNGGTTGSLANASTIANNATLNFNRTNTLTQGTDFPGITGTGIVQQLGSGTLILSGTNTYSGNTFIQNGNVQMAALPVGEIRFTVNFQGALQFAAGRTTDLSSRVLNNTNLVRIDTGGQSVTFASLGSTNSGGLVKIGTGTLTLSGTGNTFTGAFGVNAGTLDLSGSKTTASRVYCADTAGTATLTISGTLTQTTNTSGVRTLQVGQIGTGTLTVPTGGTVNGAFGMMLGENSGGSGTLNLTGGTVNLNGELWFAATTAVANVNSGTLTATRIYIGGGSSSGGSTSTLNIAGGSMTADVIDFGIGGTNTTTTVNLNSGSFSVLDFFIRRTGGVAQGTHTFNFNGATLAFRQTSTVFSELVCSVLSGGALINIASGATTTWSAVLANGGGGGGLTKSGAGTLVLTAANTYTGATSTLAGTTRVTQIISGTAGKLSQANFTNTALSVTFGTTPSATDSFKLFPGATTQTYSTVTLTNGGGLTGYYDSSTSTLSFNYNPTPATDLTVSPAVKADSSPYTGGTVSMVNPYTTSSFFVTATATTSTAIRFRLHQTSGPNTQNILATLNDFSVTAASYTRQTIISAQNSGANTTQIIVNGVGGGVFVSAFGSTTLYFFLEVSTSTGSIISRAADGSNFAITFNGA
jgi:autotransporter-associated beta strand protein